MSRHAILEEIRKLDPENDHQRIVFLSTCYEFPWDTTRALEFALFRSFCVPSVSALLDRTGEFRHRAQKRYDDTDLLISELLEWGYESERGKRSLLRINQLHGRFAIANDDFLYVLSTFVFEPIRWNERYGWRRMCEQERLALFYFWREVGRRMNIKRLPDDYDGFERFNRDYERERFHYTEANHRVGTATVEMFASWAPKLLTPLIRRTIYALLDDPVIRGFGFPPPRSWTRRLVHAALSIRARMIRTLSDRCEPRLRTRIKHRSYPDGYAIETLGPQEKPKRDG